MTTKILDCKIVKKITTTTPMNTINLAIKVDVDTDRGTRIGVPQLADLFIKNQIPATFLFSLGPDNTGRAIKKIFRRGFLKKVSRTNVVGTYGIKTLLNGVLWPGPHIGRRNKDIMRSVQKNDFEIGIHCYDHIRWQDHLHQMSKQQTYDEFEKAKNIFTEIFDQKPQTAGAAGWQANAFSLAAYDDADLLYGSDTRGRYPFFPRINGTTYKTLQIPTTLPTLDELLGRPEFEEHKLIDYYLSELHQSQLNVLTIHAEIEGMAKFEWFQKFINAIKHQPINIVKLSEFAKSLLTDRQAIPINDLVQGYISGRSGTLALQHISHEDTLDEETTR